MNLFEHIKSILSQNEKYCKDGKLFKNVIVEDALKVEQELLSLLLSDDKAIQHFFTEVGKVLVFDKIKFQKFVSNKQFLPDSYTSFKNKIGLTANGEYLTESKEVVLDFPYKDCVLEGGQTKDDQKRKEIFWNETLAPDEIDRLFEPKALTNFKRYDKKGSNQVDSISLDDNLIIKGNNLLALHSLKKVYKGKIDLVYIDPPYNTGSDSFGYNDNFNQSTWLTFMKNRLEIAKSLLSKSGVIMVQCSFHQFAFLKILMLDIFNKHLCDFNIQVRHPDRSLTGDKEYNDVIEYVLIFSNDEHKKMPYKEEVKTIDDYTIKVSINENEKPFDIINCDGKEVEVYKPEQYNVITTEPNKDNLKRISIRGSIREKNSSGRFFVKHLEHLKELPAQTLFKVPDMGDDAENHRYFYSAPIGKKNGGYYQGKPTSSNVTKKQYSNFYNFEKDYNNVAKQGGVSFRNGKKPEELIKFLIETFTQENAIILDYHLGSGTTAATSHKLNRRYIGIEQMDYIEDIAVNRMINVINGDEEGISKAINWKGGGSFVYFELAKNNYKYVDLINNAKSSKDLISVWDALNTNPFISFKINLSDYVDETDDFKLLELEVQKQILLSCLDKNQLYINYSDINDIEHKCSKEDISLNNKFYIQ
jgi:adenine-specific DNA-methyltransferase